MAERTLVFDGAFLLNKFLFSSKKLLNSEHQDVSIVFYFMRCLVEYILRYEPDDVHIIIDIGRDLKKKQKFEKYKATRGQLKTNVYSHMMDSDRHSRLELSRSILSNLLSKLPIHLYYVPYVEGDTLCGAVAIENEKINRETIIFTGDKDLIQLVDKNTKVVMMRQRNVREFDEIYSYDNLSKLWNTFKFDVNGVENLKPNLLPYFRSIAGDASDNIPGLKGFGASFVNTLLSLLVENGVDNFNNFDECYNFYTKVIEKCKNDVEGKKKTSVKSVLKFIEKMEKIFEQREFWKVQWEVSDIRYSYNDMQAHAAPVFMNLYKTKNEFDIKGFFDEIIKYEFDSVDDYKTWINIFECLRTNDWTNVLKRGKSAWVGLAHTINVYNDKIEREFIRLKKSDM